MSRKGNAYDNAVAEGFFSTLKNELTHYQTYHSWDEASRDIFAFVEGYYNRQRLDQSLGLSQPVGIRTTGGRILTWCPRNPAQSDPLNLS
jgi:putative transposase